MSSAYRWKWSHANAPLEPSTIRPGSAQKVSQMLGPLPSSVTAPSIWYDAVLVPNRNPGGSCGRPEVGRESGTGTMMPGNGETAGETARFLPGGEGFFPRHSFSFGEHYDPD